MCLPLLSSLSAWGCGDDGPPDATATATATTTLTGATATAGTTTEGGPTGTDGETSGATDPGCEGVQLAQDGVLDLDIAAIAYVTVSGQVTVNGGVLPDAAGPRGQLLFEVTPAVGAPTTIAHTLEATGPEAYEVVLPAGAATVRYVPDPAVCAASPGGPLPCTGGPLISDAPIVDSGILDLDIPSIVVGGAVTQDGATMPDATGDRGHLEFSRTGGDLVATAGFEAAGAASYEVALFPGAYDIAFAGDPALCSDGAAPVPCNTGVVLRGHTLQASGVLDVDVRRVAISGLVTVNGAAMADGAGDRGQLRFDPADAEAGGGITTPAFGASGPVSYALSLVAGAYTVALVANPGQCTGELPPTPCVGGPLLEAIDLASSGTLDVDIPRIEVSGAVTLGGAALPTEPADRGAVVFAREGGDAASVTLGSAGPIAYLLGLTPGAYTISYTAGAGLCDGVTAPTMPCGGGPLQAVNLASDGILDVDIPAIEIAGKLTLRGAALPDQAADRGAIVFAGEDGATVALPLGAGDLADYALTLLPDTYDVVYEAPEGACTPAPDNLMPCGGGRLIAGASLTSSGVLDLDIPAITITGLVTHAGAALPDLGAPRGALRWSRADGSGSGLTLDLGDAGALPYAVDLVPGRWVVDHLANADLCADGVPSFPCTDQALLGCEGP